MSFFGNENKPTSYSNNHDVVAVKKKKRAVFRGVDTSKVGPTLQLKLNLDEGLLLEAFCAPS